MGWRRPEDRVNGSTLRAMSAAIIEELTDGRHNLTEAQSQTISASRDLIESGRVLPAGLQRAIELMYAQICR